MIRKKHRLKERNSLIRQTVSLPGEIGGLMGKMDSLRKQISDRLERRDPLGMSWMGMAVWQRRIMQMVIRWKVFAS